VGDVYLFPAETGGHVSTSSLLEAAKNPGLDEVIIIGVEPDGELFVSTNINASDLRLQGLIHKASRHIDKFLDDRE